MNHSTADPAAHSFRTFLGVTAAVLVAVLVAAGLRGYRDLSVQRSRNAALQRRIAETNERIEQLGQRIDLLTTDPGTLERAAREDLGMVRPGDVVLKLTVLEPKASSSDGPLRPQSDGTVQPNPGS